MQAVLFGNTCCVACTWSNRNNQINISIALSPDVLVFEFTTRLVQRVDGEKRIEKVKLRSRVVAIGGPNDWI